MGQRGVEISIQIYSDRDVLHSMLKGKLHTARGLGEFVSQNWYFRFFASPAPVGGPKSPSSVWQGTGLRAASHSKEVIIYLSYILI
jgi:hypothetical protein